MNLSLTVSCLCTTTFLSRGSAVVCGTEKDIEGILGCTACGDTPDCSRMVTTTIDVESMRSTVLSRLHVAMRTETDLANTEFTMKVGYRIAKIVVFIQKSRAQMTHLHAFVQSRVMPRLQCLQRV